MSSEGRPRLVCRCLGVASPRIFAAIREGGLSTVAEVTKHARAGGGCGTCHPEIEEILADARGEDVEPALRLENRMICDAETRSRVEASIDSRVRPKLAERGVRVEALRIDGLRVEVSLSAPADADTREIVEHELHRCVCRDLEVETGPA